MLKRYNQTVDRFHSYMTEHTGQHQLQLHHSHIDTNKLFWSRIFSFIYITAIYIWALNDMTAIPTNFIYLTLQGFFLTWLFYAVVLQDYLLGKIYGRQTPLCRKLKYFTQIIYETALCIQFPITLVFWSFLFSIMLRNHASMYFIIQNVNLHLGPIVCLLVELYYNTFSFPVRHLWIMMIYGTGYMAINLVYSISVKVIYEPIDWKSVLSYCLLIGSYIFVFGAHYFGRFVHKKWKAPKLKNRITIGLIEQIEDIKGNDHIDKRSKNIEKISRSREKSQALDRNDFETNENTSPASDSSKGYQRKEEIQQEKQKESSKRNNDILL